MAKIFVIVMVMVAVFAACQPAGAGNVEITPPESVSGAVTVLAGPLDPLGTTDAVGTSARFFYPSGIAGDGTFLYVCDTNNSTIRRVRIDSREVTTIAGAAGSAGSADGTGSAARFDHPSSLACDGSNLYIADTYNHTIRRLALASAAVTTIAGTAGQSGAIDAIGSGARFKYPCGLACGEDCLYISDTYNHTIRRLDLATGAVSTLAGTAGTPGSGDGTASSGFSYPAGLTLAGAALYISDTYNQTVRRLALSTGEVTTVAGQAGAAGVMDGSASSARFSLPAGIASDGSYLYVTGRGSNLIRRVSIATGAVSTLAGYALHYQRGSADGPGGSARFCMPEDIVCVGAQLYVCDSYNNSIRRVDAVDGTTETFAGFREPSGSNEGAAGAEARFNHAYGITADDWNLFVCDSENHVIKRVDPSSGTVSQIAGAAGETGSTDGFADAARFSTPVGVHYAGSTLFVCDMNNNEIRLMNTFGSPRSVNTLAGQAYTWGSADGKGADALFYSPTYAVYFESGVSGESALYVTDTYNHTIRKIVVPTKTVTTPFGQAGVPGAQDGVGTAALFNHPRGIAYAGRWLFVADGASSTIRKIDLHTGEVTTFAGAAGLPGADDGIGTNARFNSPYGLFCSDGILYICDTGNNTIRKADITTGAVATLAGVAGRPGCATGTGAEARFNAPFAITGIGDYLYVCDTHNYRIVKIRK